MRGFLMILLVAVTSLCVTCTKDVVETTNYDTSKSSFLEVEEFGIYNIGTAVESFDSSLHQIYQLDGGKTMRVIDNGGFLQYTLEFSQPPAADNAADNVDIVMRHNGVSYLVTAIKSEGERVWLWDSTVGVGAVVLVW